MCSYIYVQNSDDTFTNPFTSDNYTEGLLLVFLTWTIRNVWSSIQNRSRSSLQHRGNFTVAEGVQNLDDAISNTNVLILYKTVCVYATADGAKLSRSALRSERCKSKKYSTVNLKSTSQQTALADSC